jgi:hypothetical protein
VEAPATPPEYLEVTTGASAEAGREGHSSGLFAKKVRISTKRYRMAKSKNGPPLVYLGVPSKICKKNTLETKSLKMKF